MLKRSASGKEQSCWAGAPRVQVFQSLKAYSQAPISIPSFAIPSFALTSLLDGRSVVKLNYLVGN